MNGGEVLLRMDGGEVRLSSSHGVTPGVSLAIVLPKERRVEQRYVNGCHIELTRQEAILIHSRLTQMLGL